MAAPLAKALLLWAIAMAAAKEKPPGFPCALAPTVLESKLDPPNGQAAWPANCLGLKSQGDAKTDAAGCKAVCDSHQSCSVWQLTSEDYCWIADDYDQAESCISRADEPTFQAKAGQRLQHGKVNVTATVTAGTWYDGLKKVNFGTTSDAALEAQRCKTQCYSDIYCQHWLYVKNTGNAVPNGKEIGCYVQNKDSEVGSATTLPTGQTSQGEQISHYCPIETTVPPKKEESNLWLWLLLLALLLLLLVAALIVCLLCHKEPKKEKKTRAVKVAPKKQPEVLQPLVPMPIVQQPMVTYATPTITTTVATPTYQAVPQVAPVFAQAPMVVSTAAVPMVPSVAAAPIVTTAAGGSVVVPAAGGSVVMPAAGGSVAMEQPRML